MAMENINKHCALKHNPNSCNVKHISADNNFDVDLPNLISTTNKIDPDNGINGDINEETLFKDECLVSSSTIKQDNVTSEVQNDVIDTNCDSHHRHTKSHTYESRYECTICNKTLSCKPSLDRHSRIHTGEKCYTCTTRTN